MNRQLKCKIVKSLIKGSTWQSVFVFCVCITWELQNQIYRDLEEHFVSWKWILSYRDIKESLQVRTWHCQSQHALRYVTESSFIIIMNSENLEISPPTIGNDTLTSISRKCPCYWLEQVLRKYADWVQLTDLINVFVDIAVAGFRWERHVAYRTSLQSCRNPQQRHNALNFVKEFNLGRKNIRCRITWGSSRSFGWRRRPCFRSRSLCNSWMLHRVNASTPFELQQSRNYSME